MNRKRYWRYCTRQALEALTRSTPDWISGISEKGLSNILVLMRSEHVESIDGILLEAYRQGIRKQFIRQYAKDIYVSGHTDYSHPNDIVLVHCDCGVRRKDNFLD